MKMTFRIMMMLFLLTSFTGCNSQNSTVKSLRVAEFEKGISQQDVQIVDVRTPGEYSERRILNSRNINVNDTSFEREMKQLDRKKPLYLYCLMGSRSARAGEWAVKNGFKEVYNLDGGITAWIGDKKPVITEPAAGKPASMSFDDYLQMIKHPDKLVLVDFSAVWCGPCKILKPIVHKVADRNSKKVALLDIDVDRNSAVASAMNIRSIPLLVLYKQGKEVWRNLGLTDEDMIEQKIMEFSK